MSAPTPPIKDIVITSKDPELVTILKDIKLTLEIREGRLGDSAFRFIDYEELVAILQQVVFNSLKLTELATDPGDPFEGQSVLWQSNGIGSGDDGDIMIKITAGGVTKIGTVVDFSAL